ncbi:aldehyde dehydrogenase family protein [Staphylococcus saprophyticus]|uniref:aldehyde dehydrogenase family protein n=1 Tax=Staphylococcus saprophyticus TaxID=29385 RepID=UPI00142F7539|nr:aldehyde dehydrogenase family protein [Staphylococcus saprophyticus]NJE84193.1 aldehyde dehydrogenase family protein [Staphylococcus saprophyticus]
MSKNFVKHYINGQRVKSNSENTIDVINPSTEEIIGEMINRNEKDVDDAVASAKKVYLKLRKTSIEERKQYLKNILVNSRKGALMRSKRTRAKTIIDLRRFFYFKIKETA